MTRKMRKARIQDEEQTNPGRRRPTGTAPALRRRACAFDHLRRSSTFPVFSSRNPYAAAYYLLMLSPVGCGGDSPRVGLAVERYLLGELSDSERDRIEEHFFDCRACAEEVRAGAILVANARAVLAQSGSATVG